MLRLCVLQGCTCDGCLLCGLRACGAALRDRPMHRLGRLYVSRSGICTGLQRKGALAVLAQYDLIDMCQTLTTRLDGEGGGEVVAALVRDAVHVGIELMHAGARLLIQRVIGMADIVQQHPRR